MKIFTLQLCCTKKPIRYALNATNKNLLFSFLLGFPPCYFSSAFGSRTHFSLKPRRNSLLDKPRTLWIGPPPLTILKPCGALNKAVHTHISSYSETWSRRPGVRGSRGATPGPWPPPPPAPTSMSSPPCRSTCSAPRPTPRTQWLRQRRKRGREPPW